MIIDVNAYLGPFAFRRLRHNTASTLLKLMDSKAIDKAVVSSASAITYRNAQAGNEELAEEVQPHRDRLIPYAVINPAYAGWRDDLKACHEEFGHERAPPLPEVAPLRPRRPDLPRPRSDRATERGMVVSIPVRVEDVRQRSWLVDVPEVPLEEIAALVKACPDARFVLLNGSRYVSSTLGARTTACRRTTSSRSRAGLAAGQRVRSAHREPGGRPSGVRDGDAVQLPRPALLNLEVLDASKEDKEKIAWRNAERWLAGKHRVDRGRDSFEMGLRLDDEEPAA